MTPQIVKPKLLPGQQCTFTSHTDDAHEFNPSYAADYERLAREGKPRPTRCEYVEPTEAERSAAIRADMLTHLRQRVIDNAERAISTMEGFMRNARNRLTEVQDNIESIDFTGEPRFLLLPEQVLHELSWGLANASSGIQSAMSSAHDYLRIKATP